VLVVIAAAYHLSAYAAYRRSFATSATLDARKSSAQLAAHIEPWNRQFAERATVMAEWRHGATYVSQGAYLPAMLLLADAYKHDVGDKQLLALFQDAQTELTIHSNYKAHVQHAHEGPGGTLRPQDLLR